MQLVTQQVKERMVPTKQDMEFATKNYDVFKQIVSCVYQSYKAALTAKTVDYDEFVSFADLQYVENIYKYDSTRGAKVETYLNMMLRNKTESWLRDMNRKKRVFSGTIVELDAPISDDDIKHATFQDIIADPNTIDMGSEEVNVNNIDEIAKFLMGLSKRQTILIILLLLGFSKKNIIDSGILTKNDIVIDIVRLNKTKFVKTNRRTTNVR